MLESSAAQRVDLATAGHAPGNDRGPSPWQRRAWLLPILGAYLVIATLYAVKVPAWQAPDEPAHYNYVHELATSGEFPVLRMGDYDQAYLDQLTSNRFPDSLSIAPVRYEAHQPPLYYLLQAGVFLVTGGDLVSLRLTSVALGALFIWLVYEVARLVVAGQPAVWLGATALVAFLPMHVAMAASVNNDALAEVLLTALLLFSLRLLARCLSPSPPSSSNFVALGLLTGLALITKVSAYVAVPVVLLIPLICWYERRRNWNLEIRNSKLEIRDLKPTLLVLLPALLIALPWYVRNALLYGNWDILGRRWHDLVVVGQLRTAELLAQAGPAAVLERMVVWSFDSFWGVFGWMGVWMDGRIYTALLAFCVVVAVGCMGLVVSQGTRQSANEPMSEGARERNQHPRFQRYAFSLLGLSALLTGAIYVAYNLIFVQPQGRYLFPALPTLALLLALGWQEALRHRLAPWAALAPVLIAGAAVIWGWQKGAINSWSVAIPLSVSVLLLAWRALQPRLPGRLQLPLTAMVFSLPFLALMALDFLALQAYILPQLS